MKKIITYLMIALFLISVVPAQPLAVTAREKRAIAKPSVITTPQISTEATESCMERLSKINPDASEEELRNRCTVRKTLTSRLKAVEARKIKKLNELKQIRNNPKLIKYNETNAFKARIIAQDKLTKARENYLATKERYQIARQNYIAAQKGFKEAKTRFKECEGEETAECNQWREEIKERAKEFLLNTADRIIEHLNKIKAKVESNEDLSEEEVAEILEEIDEMIQEIENAKSTVESSEDKDEIIEASKTIKQAWLRVKRRLLIHTGRIVNARIGGIIVKIKHLEVRLERILARMEEKGINTSEIQSLVDEFNAKINESKENYENALDKFKEAASAANVETAHELAVEGHRYLKAAHKSLQEAQHLLRDIVLSIKQAGGEDELNAPEDEAEEEETDEEDEEEGCTIDEDCEEDEVCIDGECEDAEEDEEGETEDE